MNNLEIIIQRKVGDAWPVVVEHHRPDALSPVRKEGILRLDETELLRQSSPLDYGRVLGEALFRGEVGDAFVAARAQSRAEETDLRLLLTVEDQALRTKRWERLCARIDGVWNLLALDRRIFFSHYLPSVTDRLFRPIGRHALRALVVVASPAGLAEYRLDPFPVEPAVENVRAALGRIPCNVLASGEEPGPVAGAEGPATLEALCAQIEFAAVPYTLLHFMCHGLLSDDKTETRLLLTGEEGGLNAVAGAHLIERLRGIGEGRGLPHFAFLAACSSAAPAVEGARGGLGQQLVRDLGMPAVVAMTDLVSVETAQGLAAAFYPRLWAHGEVDRALVEATASLAERPDITVAALYGRLGGQPLFSETLDRAPAGEEIESGLDRLAVLLEARAPVLLPRFQEQAGVLRRGLAGDEAGSQQARDEINALCREVLNLTFNGLALGDEPGPYDARCPFPGLSPFGEDQQAFFFGRRALTGRLGERLAGYNFLALLGPSGSGKSSLVQAGLLPLLKEREPDLQVVSMMPGSDPAARLEAQLPQEGDRPGVLVVDQFEELFTECADEEKRRAFVERLLALSKELRLVVVMRADYLGDCAPYRGLLAEMEDHQELVRPLDGTELRRVMEQQAAAAALRFDPGLVYAIMDAVQDQPGAMPLLQHGLQQLWQRRHGIWLRAEEYEALGGIREAIAGTADGVYDGLASEEERARARDILMRLTRLDEDVAPAEDWRHTRRRVAMADLVPAGRDPALTERLVTRLEDRHLLATRLNPVTGQTEVEVAHEALIDHWPRLRQWLARDREALRLREGVRRAAQEWKDQAWAESYLVHRGARLARAEALAGESHLPLNAREQGYVEACVAYRLAGTLEEIQAAVARNETAGAAYDRLRQDEGHALIRNLEEPGVAGPGWGLAPATLDRVRALLGLEGGTGSTPGSEGQPLPEGGGGQPFGPVARAAAGGENRPATRRTAALALAATYGTGAMERLEAARAAQERRGRGRRAEMWGTVAGTDPGVEALAGRLGAPDRVAIWLWRVGRRLARDRRRIGALAWRAAIGAGLGLGLWRAVTAPWARLTWTLQLGMNIWWGGILGMLTGLALILPDYLLLSSGAEAGPERAGQERRATGLAVVLGTCAFGLAQALIMLAGGTFSLSGKGLVLLAGFVAGLGLSLAFCDRPWKRRTLGRWPLRLGAVIVAFGLAQAIFLAAGSSGSMSIVVSGEEYAGKLGAFGWSWWQQLTEENPDWVRVLSLLDSVMVGIALFAAMALGFSRAVKHLGRDGSE